MIDNPQTTNDAGTLLELSSALHGYCQSAKIINGVRKEWVDGLIERANKIDEAIKEIYNVR